jgi:hypothetical protein
VENDDKKIIKIVLAVFGCLGCAGAAVLLALVGLGFWASSQAVVPMAPPITPPGPLVAPPALTPFVTPPAPPGWTPFAHAVQCPNNTNLRLTQFRAAYPPMYKVMPCQQQQPRPWSYVTFHLEDPSGAADKQITLGYARGIPNQQILESVATQLAGQLGAPPPRLLGNAPFVARGQGLLRRDSVFTVPTTLGTFAPGSYLMRQLLVSGTGLNAEGILITLVHRVRTTEPAALLESNAALLQTANSIQF